MIIKLWKNVTFNRIKYLFLYDYLCFQCSTKLLLGKKCVLSFIYCYVSSYLKFREKYREGEGID